VKPPNFAKLYATENPDVRTRSRKLGDEKVFTLRLALCEIVIP